MGKEKMRDRENTEFTGKEEKRERNKTKSARGRKEKEEQRVVSGFRETFGRQNLNGKAGFTVVSSVREKVRGFSRRGNKCGESSPTLTTVVCARGINAVCSAIINTEYQIRGIWNVIIMQT